MNLSELKNCSCCDWLESVRHSRKLILAIVFLALLLDNILLTVVVPIIADYLLTLELVDGTAFTDAGSVSSTVWNHSLRHNHHNHLNNDTGNHYNHHYDHWLYNLTPFYNWTDLGLTFPPGELAPRVINNENSRVGWLFSSKAIVQLLANPFVGTFTNRYGYSIPMFGGFIVLFTSSLLYAFGESYWVLFSARAVQGIGSSCTAIAGMTMLAQTYPDDKDRSRAMGIALGGLALGVLIGYPFGGFSYEFIGKSFPFLLIAALALVEGALQVWVLRPCIKEQDAVVGTPLPVLLRDPYILIASGAILFPEMAMAMLEPTLPIWLIDKMNAPNWQLGLVFVPDSVGFWLGCSAFGMISYRLGRWICVIIALCIMGVCLSCIPFATHVYHLIVPHFGLGLALGIVDASMMPLLALLVDKRHVAVYGSVYAIGQVSVSLGFAIGPSVGGILVRKVGFPKLVRGIAALNILYSPICYLLRDPPSREENTAILMKDGESGVVHPSYTQEETFRYQQLNED